MSMHDVKIISPVTYYKEQAEAKKQFERVAEQIRRLWDEGTDIRIIGDKCEVPLSQVRAVLIPHIWVTPELGLDSPSQSLQDVASTMGVSRERVRQILVENGIHDAISNKSSRMNTNVKSMPKLSVKLSTAIVKVSI